MKDELLLNETKEIHELQVNKVKDQIIVAIGSTNPIKVKAVKNAFADEEIHLVPVLALSNVSSQPLSDEETLQGAIFRAKDCLEKTEAEVAFGLESGVHFTNGQAYLCYWGAIVDRQQKVYFTNGPLILLPHEFHEALLAGECLEDIMHHYTGIHKLGTKQGAVNIFTENRINREEVLTQMVKVLIGQYRYYRGI